VSNTFPAFIRAEYDPSGRGFAEFQTAVENQVGQAKRRFQAGFDEISNVMQGALQRGLKGGGALDLGVPEMRQASNEARHYASQLDVAVKSAVSLANSTGDTSRKTQAYIQSLRAAATEAREVAEAHERSVTAYTRLQAETDRQVAANDRLKQSYRDLFAEQARAANAAEAAQRFFNSQSAPGLTRRATDNGAGFSALDAQAQSNAAAQQRYNQVMQESARTSAAYQRELAELTQQLFPLETQATRVTQQIELLSKAHQRGDITAAQFAAGQQQLNQTLVQMQGGYRDTRQGMIQVGQQMQDVAISMIGGQRAGTVLAQQLPQLAFAASNFGGKIGAVATLLSGPWSLALVAGSFVLGNFVDQLIAGSSESDRLNDKSLSLSDALSEVAYGTKAAEKALDDYNDAQARTGESTRLQIALNLQSAEAKLKEALATRELVQAELARQSQASAAAGGDFGNPALRLAVDAVEANQKEIDRLNRAVGNLYVDFGKKSAAAQVDPLEAIRQKYDDIALAIERAAQASAKRGEVDRTVGKQLADLERQRKAEIDAYERSKKKPTRQSVSDPALPPVTGQEIARILGTSVISGKRSAAENRAVGGAPNSLHLSGLAIDIPLTVNGKPLTKEGIRKELDAAGVQIRELLGPGDKGHGDHFHIGFARRRLRPDQVDRNSERQSNAAEALSRALSEVDQRVANISGQFDRIPSDIDRARNAQIELNQEIERLNNLLAEGGLSDEQKAIAERAKATAERAISTTLPDFRRRALDEQIQSLEREESINRALIKGDEERAELLRLQYDVMQRRGLQTEAELQTELEKDQVFASQYEKLRSMTLEAVAQERAFDRLDRAGKTVQAQLGEIDRLRGSIEQTFADLPNDARGAIKGLFGSIRQQANDMIARSITDKIFGPLFQRLEDDLTGQGGMARSADKASDALDELAKSASEAAAAVRGAANDNGKIGNGAFATKAGGLSGNAAIDEIIVTAATRGASPILISKVASAVVGKDTKLGDALGKITKSLVTGGYIGQTASSLVFGRKSSSLGSMLGGAVGQELGKELGKNIGGLLGKAAGPIGGALGGLLGSVVFSAFRKPKTGTATIGGSGSSLQIASFGGNSSKFREAAGSSADSAISTIQRIAEQLGASVDASRGSVSIGLRDGKYRVDPTGKGATKTKKGAIDFGEDAEAAVRAATMDLIKDGVLTGLRASTNRIITGGKDLEAALQKALDFESVFSRLKAYKDPVGAALDGLDKEFVRLQKIFNDAGASAEEYAQLEELYGIERAKAIKEAGERITASLKSLFDELTVGNEALSLRTRLGAAQAAYDPLKARVLAGDKSAYDEFAAAARQLLDVQRQFSGSQSPYFALLDEITKITKERIDAETNIATIAAGRSSPFDSRGNATGAANDNAAVVGAIELQTQQLLQGFAQIMNGGIINNGIQAGSFRLPAFL
jgi:uncharacterized protein YcbK (DUF882 family)